MLYKSKKILFIIAMLLLLFNYFETLIAYKYFYEYYNTLCDNLFICYLFNIETTFASDGGIGGYVN